MRTAISGYFTLLYFRKLRLGRVGEDHREDVRVCVGVVEFQLNERQVSFDLLDVTKGRFRGRREAMFTVAAAVGI